VLLVVALIAQGVPIARAMRVDPAVSRSHLSFRGRFC